MTALQAPALEVAHENVLVGGARMHFLRAGHGPALLLLHGLLGTASHWAAILPWLAPHWAIYAPDALGIGDSDRPSGLDVGLAATADRVAEFMDVAGVGSAHVLGTSHGGAVAIMLASRHPGLVRSLLLHAPANPFSTSADPLIRFYRSAPGRWLAHRAPALPHSVQRLAVARMFGDGHRLPEESVRKFMDSLRTPGTVDYVLRILDSWREEMRVLDAVLPTLERFPAMLLWGECDRVISRESLLALRCYFGEARVREMAGVGHLPFEELPQAFAAEVGTFLRECDRATQDRPRQGVA